MKRARRHVSLAGPGYFPDPDAHTRGPGAIAAMDGKSKRKAMLEHLGHKIAIKRELDVMHEAMGAAVVGSMAARRGATYSKTAPLPPKPKPFNVLERPVNAQPRDMAAQPWGPGHNMPGTSPRPPQRTLNTVNGAFTRAGLLPLGPTKITDPVRPPRLSPPTPGFKSIASASPTIQPIVAITSAAPGPASTTPQTSSGVSSGASGTAAAVDPMAPYNDPDSGVVLAPDASIPDVDTTPTSSGISGWWMLAAAAGGAYLLFGRKK